MGLDVTYRLMPSSSADLDLVDLRRALGDLTQAEAAQLLQITPNTWARWEHGEPQPHPSSKALSTTAPSVGEPIRRGPVLGPGRRRYPQRA